MRTPRGQTLVLLALTTLLCVLMTMMTLSIASHVRDRIELQMVADASAYSTAVATARSYNTASLLNRAMVSQWAAMCGVGALHAWGSMHAAYFDAFAGAAMEMNDPNPGYRWGSPCNDGNGYFACSGRWEIDPNPLTPPATDCDEQRRRDLRNERDALLSAGDTLAWGSGWGALDRDVVRQVRNLWQSMDDLGRIQMKTHQQLRTLLDQQDLATKIVGESGIKEPVTVHRGAAASNVAYREVMAASPIGVAPTDAPAPRAHLRAMIHAIMGTRGDPFTYHSYHPPRSFTQWMIATGRGPGVQHALPNGAWIRYDWVDLTRNVSHPGAYGQMDVNPYSQSLRSQPPTSGPMQTNNNPWDCNQCYERWPDSGGGWAPPLWEPGDVTPWRGPALALGFDGLRAAAWAGNLRVQYRAPNGFGCGGNDNRSNVADTLAFVWYTVPVGPEVPRHYAFHHHPRRTGDPLGSDETVGHAGHGEINSNDHWMGNNNTQNSVLPYSIGFVFPAYGDQGAGNAWGQPKTPVLMWRNQNHAADPWNMISGMQFGQTSAGAKLDLDGGVGPLALGNAIAYYHRTGHWAEAPSFLNPFWRATLVPMDIDERRTGGAAPTQDSTPTFTAVAPGTDVRLMLNGMGKANEAAAFTSLQAAGYVGGQ